MRIVHSLLDANSIIKYYVPLPGSKVIKYLFDRSPTTQIYITNIQVAEVVSLFYKLRREKIIPSDDSLEEFKDTFFNDIKNKKILVYDFTNEHILDFKVYKTITTPRPPHKKPERTFIPEFGGYVQELKDIADTGDAIMLMIAREMNFLNQKDVFLVTSDGRVKDVAKSLGIKVIDPEKASVKNLPEAIDQRKQKRKRIELRALCFDCELNTQLPTARTLDICDNGVRLLTKKPIMVGKQLQIKLSPFSDPHKDKEIEGRVVWCNDDRVGIQFLTPQQVI